MSTTRNLISSLKPIPLAISIPNSESISDSDVEMSIEDTANATSSGTVSANQEMYSSLEFLQYGNFAKVYKATYQGQVIAVKRLYNFEGIADFKHEKEIYEKLQTYNLKYTVKYIGYYEDVSKNQYDMALEFMPNRDLLDYLDANPLLSELDRYKIAKKITAVVAELHDANIIHNDIKPENFLQNSQGQFKIADFGLSKFLGESFYIQDERAFGTPKYMAPEIFQQAKYSTASDIYALGCTIYSICALYSPWPEDAEFSVLSDAVISGQRPTFPSNLSKDMQNLISACWHQDPSKRPDATEVYQRLNAMIENEIIKLAALEQQKSLVSAAAAMGSQESTNLEINFGDLEIQQFIEKTNFSKVFFATYQGKPVAVKKLYIYPGCDTFGNSLPQPVEAIRHEAKMLKYANSVSCQSVIGYVGYGEAPLHNLYMIVMNQCERRDLHNWLFDEPETFNETPWIILSKTAEALQKLHAHNIIHGDLVWGNVLVTDYNVQFCDFTYAQQVDGESAITLPEAYGTFNYMAPEIFTNKLYSKASDIYAFGSMIYTFIETTLPFEDMSDIEIIDKTTKGERPALSEQFPENLAKLVKWCWQSNPKDRPTIQKVVENLEEILPQLPSASPKI